MVVAPSGDRSGVSHAITGDVAITLERRGNFPVPAYACSGTPADCVFLASTELGERADLVVSGINYGPNLADDVNYSGTVAGAVEACLLGIPALAVSLACEYARPSDGPHWSAAAEIVRRCVERGYETFSDIRYYWNLNVPDVAIDAILGIAVTRLGRKRICGRMVGEDGDAGASYYRAWESPFETDRSTLGTDIGAVHANYASLTPLVLDRTAPSAPGSSETFADR
jgi:5'-nucleotidase